MLKDANNAKKINAFNGH